jgi:hypothetical protein
MPKVKNQTPDPESMLIEVPLADVLPATWGLHINTHLTLNQSHALRRLTSALDQRLSRLANGRRIVNSTDAVKYLLERISDEAPATG